MVLNVVIIRIKHVLMEGECYITCRVLVVGTSDYSFILINTDLVVTLAPPFSLFFSLVMDIASSFSTLFSFVGKKIRFSKVDQRVKYYT